MRTAENIAEAVVIRPIEDETNLDELRKSAGLESIDKYKQKTLNRGIENKKRRDTVYKKSN